MTFPYTAWVLMPSFKPVEISIVGRTNYSFGETWLKSEGGKTYSLRSVFPTKDDAIKYGHADLSKQQAAVDKKQENINKRRAALEKASKQ